MFRSGIRARLRLALAFVVVALGGLWLLTDHFQQKVLLDTGLRRELDALHFSLPALREAEKDFVIHHRESAAEEFRTVQAAFEVRARSLIRALQASGRDPSGLAQVVDDMASYRGAFERITDRLLAIGLHYGQGAYAELETNARQIATIVESHPALMAQLLLLRSHEKDFLLRREPTYSVKFATAISDFRGQVFFSDLDNASMAALQGALNRYYANFQDMVQKEIDIGLDADKGLTGDLRRLMDDTEQNFERTRSMLDRELDADVARAATLSRAVIPGVALLMLLLLTWNSRGISRSLVAARSVVRRLTDGDLETPVEVDRRDEIGTLLLGLEDMRARLQESTAALRTENAVRARQAQLAAVLQGEKDPEQLAGDTLTHLARALNCVVGAFYGREGDSLRLLAGYGMEARPDVGTLAAGETLAGQAMLTLTPRLLHDVPGGYLAVSSACGSASPATLLVLPLVWNSRVWGVLELGSFEPLPDDTEEFAVLAGEAIAVSLQAAGARVQAARLLAQAHAREAQAAAQHAALEDANARLAVQSESLRASESRLQAQQVQLQSQQEELRVMNEELEEQSRLLHQRTRDLERRNADLERQLRQAC